MRVRLQRFLHRSRIISMLPLSMLPFLTFFFVAAGIHGSGVRLHGGDTPWKAPNVTLTAAELSYTTPRAYSGQIPILLFHGINYQGDLYSVTPQQFAREMALVQRLGYHTISIYQYIAWREGKLVRLPSRPILLTFDDGRFDTYRGADEILARYHMQATIFVIVGQVQRNNLFYCTWDELKKMQKSGRWDIQFHANNGHVLIPKDAKGDRSPYYATREYKNGHLESMAQFAARVNGDISTGVAILHQHGFADLVTMAMPFGEYGQTSQTNGDYNLAVELRLAKIIRSHFIGAFIQSGHAYTPYATAVEGAQRKEVHSDTTLAGVYQFLYQADPSTISAESRACVPGYFQVTIYQGPSCLRSRAK